MININHVPALIEKFKIITLEVKNIDGFRIFDIITKDIDLCIKKWNELVPFLSDHKRLSLYVGDANMQKGGLKGKLTWMVFNDGSSNEDQPRKENSQMAGTGPGIIGMKDYLDSKVKEIEQSYEIKHLKEQLGKKEEEGGGEGSQWIGFLERMINKDSAGNTLHGPETVMGTQQEEMEKVMESICNKVPIEKVLRLLRAVDKNPALVDQALKFI